MDAEANQTPERGRRTDKQYERLCRALELRAQGKTFQEIGDELGITRQAASQMIKAYQRTRRGLPRRPVTNPPDVSPGRSSQTPVGAQG